MRNFNALPHGKIASVAVIGGVGLAVLAGCGSDYIVEGTVHKGADGRQYVIPDDADRAVYASKQNCIDDVKAHENQIKAATGKEINPSDACQPVTKYRGNVFPRGYIYGLIMNRGQEWRSNKIQSWTPVQDGMFAAKGEPLQHNIATAPKGVRVGDHTSVQEHEGGFFDENGRTGTGGHPIPEEHPVAPIEPHPVEPHIVVK